MGEWELVCCGVFSPPRGILGLPLTFEKCRVYWGGHLCIYFGEQRPTGKDGTGSSPHLIPPLRNPRPTSRLLLFPRRIPAHPSKFSWRDSRAVWGRVGFLHNHLASLERLDCFCREEGKGSGVTGWEGCDNSAGIALSSAERGTLYLGVTGSSPMLGRKFLHFRGLG